MKKLLTSTFLIFFLGTIICSSSDAKVLPVIEGSELLDSLASQNSEEINMAELTAMIYKYVELEYLINPLNNFPRKKLKNRDNWICCYSLMYNSFGSPLYPKPDNKLRFTRQIHTPDYLENI